MCLILDNFEISKFYKLFIPIPHKTLCLFPTSPNFQKLSYRSQGELNIHKSIWKKNIDANLGVQTEYIMGDSKK